MRKTKSSNEELQNLILKLRKTASVEKVNLWKRLASDLSKPTRQRRIVNVSRLNRFTKENEIVVVPGKVLSGGEMNHKVQVAAFNFSKSAADKITQAQGKALTIDELMKSNPKAKGVRIIG